MQGLISAIRTLTIIPVPGRGKDDFGASLAWFPVPGFLLGALLYGTACLWLLIPGLAWPEGLALFLVLFQTFLTRGLHLDGLADWADSWGGRDREQRLAIMKDSHIGAFGVTALVLILLAKWVFFTRLASSQTLVWLIYISGLTRAMLVALLIKMPYAGKEPGMGLPFVQGASGGRLLSANLLIFAAVFYFGPCAFVLWAAAWVLALVLRSRFRKTFGGVTGDLLGAGHELTEIFLLMLCAVPGPALQHFLGWSRTL